jgi:hypothetical protein
VWSKLPDGVPESRFAGGECQSGMIVLRIDGIIVVAHSKDDRSAGTFKRTFGLHPLACWIDNTGELASLMPRAGNAGSNSAADRSRCCPIAQIPKHHRRQLLVTCDAAGASHDLIDWLVNQNHAADRRVEFSVGFDVDDDVRAAIGKTRHDCWVPVLDNTDGSVREDADVAEITALMRERVDRTGWPKNLCFTVRRVKPAPGEQPTLFHLDGYKVLMLCHDHANNGRADARRPLPCPRQGRGRGTRHKGHWSRSSALKVSGCQQRVVSRRDDRHRPARLVQAPRLTGDLSTAEPKTLRYRVLTASGASRKWARSNTCRVRHGQPSAERFCGCAGSSSGGGRHRRRRGVVGQRL